jgi:hypothetical protein
MKQQSQNTAVRPAYLLGNPAKDWLFHLVFYAVASRHTSVNGFCLTPFV